MSAVLIVLPLALIVVLAAVAAFLWAAHRGQFDDLTTPAIRMLHDDEEPRDGAPSAAEGAPRREEGAGKAGESQPRPPDDGGGA
jgi:cbb3-type cytochrome oxidase maturation protein